MAINARAIEEHINLAATLEGADRQTREWVASNALPHGRKPREPGHMKSQARKPLGVWAQLHEE